MTVIPTPPDVLLSHHCHEDPSCGVTYFEATAPRVRKRARVIGEVRVSRSGMMRFPRDLHTHALIPIQSWSVLGWAGETRGALLCLRAAPEAPGCQAWPVGVCPSGQAHHGATQGSPTCLPALPWTDTRGETVDCLPRCTPSSKPPPATVQRD